MRLLTASDDDGEYTLVEQFGKDIKPYAILSHTWGSDHDEISFKDLERGAYKDKAGFRKLEFCRLQSAHDGLEYFWVDTCCIDKSSSAELMEAINSMYRWYQGAAKCYVYLADVTIDQSRGTTLECLQLWRQQFRESRWFRRGWTLQELVAPKIVEFFDSDGARLGDRNSLIQEIHESTKIPVDALTGDDPGNFSIEARFSWAEGRETKREEDAVYSLLGLFDIYMPLIYGEGRERALKRLVKELQDMTGTRLPSASLQTTNSAPQHLLERGLLPSYDLGLSFGKKLAFKKVASIDGPLSAAPVTPMWPGNIIRTRYSKTYLWRRDSISQAAYEGRWVEVFDLLDLAVEKYGENWSNAVRLRHPHEVNRLSFWTPLHQAAHLRAPTNIIKKLVDRGSLRTIRSVKNNPDEFDHPDLTPADIARESGHFHLADILAPVIQHTVPHQTLARLQSLFHEMIRADWGIQMAHLVLPDLVALTELRVPEMWFPVGEQHETRNVGYLYEIDGRKLMVTKLGIEEISPAVYMIE